MLETTLCLYCEKPQPFVRCPTHEQVQMGLGYTIFRTVNHMKGSVACVGSGKKFSLRAGQRF